MGDILFTGASGFLGTNILPLLKEKYSDVATLGRSMSNDISVDLSKESPQLAQSYRIVLHAAGKGHSISNTKKEDKEFFDVNFTGTKNLCEALEKAGVPKSFIYISSVAVYGSDGGNLIDETHPLNGITPYALSKIQTEQFLKEWCEKNGIVLSILRPSLIAGKNPPGNLGAMVEGIRRGYYVNINGGKACKSVLMADDIVNIIPLAKDVGGIYNVCDTEQVSFRQLSELLAGQLGKKKPLSIPYWAAKSIAMIGDITGMLPFDSLRLKKITQTLTFSNRKAIETLGWQPLNVLSHFEIGEL